MGGTQCGVVTWRQLRLRGWPETRIRRAARRRELVRVHPQVYVDHTGPLTEEQRAWAAVLWAEPAALWGPSLLGTNPGEPVHLAIDRKRRLAPPDGIVLHRVAHLSAMTRPGTRPPRLALEHDALLRAASAATETDVVAILTSTIGRLGTTVAAMRRALELHPTVRRRRLIVALLDDIDHGTDSVLEHGFLTRVERPHGLPSPVRQSARMDGRERRDLEYPEFGLVVELDGRLHHESWAAGNRDAGRDLRDIAAGSTVLRLRWAQVMRDPCSTAALLAQALRARGWNGAVKRCSSCQG